MCFTLCYRRCLYASGLFPMFKQFSEIEQTKSPPIIDRVCIFKSQNLSFTSC